MDTAATHMKESLNKSLNLALRCRNYSRHGDLDEYIAQAKGDAWRSYRSLWTRANNLETQMGYPLYVVLETFFRCNLRCIMCDMSFEQVRRQMDHRQTMSRDTLFNVLDQLGGLGTPSVALNAYNEALLDKELLYAGVERAKNNGILDVFFSTNATLLDEEAANRILDLEPTQIRFSFDAHSPETYEQIRRGARFETVRDNILRFMELKERRGQVLPVTRLSFVNMTVNTHEMRDYLAFWMDKADYISIQRYGPVDDSPEALALCVEDTPPPSGSYTCAYPFTTLYLRANGDALSCCSKLTFSTKVGNIHDMTVQECFNSPGMQYLRECMKSRELERVPRCHRCLKFAKLIV